MSAHRPRDRKAQIARAAQSLFSERGYHAVGVDTVAAAVGIGGSALYRHYPGKQDLLAQVVFDGVARFDDALGEITGSAASSDAVLAALAAVAVDHRVAVLWQREVRHLSTADQAAVSARVRTLEERVSRALSDAQPDDDPALRRTRAVLAVLWSPSYHHAAPPRDEFQRLLMTLASAVWAAPLTDPPSPQATEPNTGGRRPRASHREKILAVASQLFAERGFGAVSVDDIGAVLGVTGASIYRYFATKADLLHTALARAAEALHLSLSRALSIAAAPDDALDRILASYVDVMLEHRDITQLLITEVMNLPDEPRAGILRTQREYVTEWVHLVRESHPSMSRDAGRVTVHAALTVINDTLRTGRHTEPEFLRADAITLGQAVIHAT